MRNCIDGDACRGRFRSGWLLSFICLGFWLGPMGRSAVLQIVGGSNQWCDPDHIILALTTDHDSSEFYLAIVTSVVVGGPYGESGGVVVEEGWWFQTGRFRLASLGEQTNSMGFAGSTTTPSCGNPYQAIGGILFSKRGG